jgi:spermidine synthase
LCALFLCSGASALIFENLWFHQAGLAFGNSIWASSVVLSAFMAGLALGSALTARYGGRLKSPLAAYALLELLIAGTGLCLVLLLPTFGSILAPLVNPWLDDAAMLNGVRFVSAFLLLLVPSTAMGATLPLVTQALTREGMTLGRALGALYGWNTFGAVAGVCAAELLFVGWWGIRGAAWAAVALNIAAAFGAYALSRGWRVESEDRRETRRGSIRPRLHTAAAFLSGFCLLALEVLWFRLLSLHVMTTSVAFALMLAIVLVGIASGGLLASAGLRKASSAKALGLLAFLPPFLVVLGYHAFSGVIHHFKDALIERPNDVLGLALPLILPVTCFSGFFFVLLGESFKDEDATPMQTTGSLVLWNTLGAAAGSFAAGFVLLPRWGLEKSFFAITALYFLNGLIILAARQTRSRGAYAAAVLGFAALWLFPWGLIQSHLLAPARRMGLDASTRVIALREGLIETILYLQRDWFGVPVAKKLVTNAYSMSGTDFRSRRYMKLFVYWPIAVHPRPRRALLISYGVGCTAKALTDTAEFESIDVVDISRDILDTHHVIYPNPSDQPLRDPRVRVHVEDGRYFLQSTRERFDLITGEPPPPRAAGVVNLYTKEYFGLMRERLAEGGIATYWLPMHSLSDESARAITKAFCEMFEDCSLWGAMGPELMLVGSRNAGGPVSESHFTRQWSVPRVREELEALGFERPEQIGALFIGDAPYLREYLRADRPLTDDRPKRILAAGSMEGLRRLYADWTDVEAAGERFAKSEWIRQVWPSTLRQKTLPYFEIQGWLNGYFNNLGAPLEQCGPMLHLVLTRTSLRAPVVWMMGGSPDVLHALSDFKTQPKQAGRYLEGIQAFSRRRFAEAASAFSDAQAVPPLRHDALRFEAYARFRAGQSGEARRLVAQHFSMPFEDWLKRYWY